MDVLTQTRMSGRILRDAASAFDMPRKVLVGPGKTPRLALVRFGALWLARETTGCSLPRLGRLCGGRDHTTVLHAVRRFESMLRRRESAALLVLDRIVTHALVRVEKEVSHG